MRLPCRYWQRAESPTAADYWRHSPWVRRAFGWEPVFVASVEAYAHVNYKNKIVEIDEEGTTITRCHSGKPCRLIRNRFTDSWVGREAEILPFPLQSMRVGFKLAEKARYEGKIEEGGLACGQSAGLIDSIKAAGEIVQDVMAEAAEVLIARFEQPRRTANPPT
jgi:enoyl-[acyl-carrier protein] reductase II